MTQRSFKKPGRRVGRAASTSVLHDFSATPDFDSDLAPASPYTHTGALPGRYSPDRPLPVSEPQIRSRPLVVKRLLARPVVFSPRAFSPSLQNAPGSFNLFRAATPLAKPAQKPGLAVQSVCEARSVRAEVMHAKGIAGTSVRPPVFTAQSKKVCS